MLKCQWSHSSLPKTDFCGWQHTEQSPAQYFHVTTKETGPDAPVFQSEQESRKE